MHAAALFYPGLSPSVGMLVLREHGTASPQLQGQARLVIQNRACVVGPQIGITIHSFW